MAIAIVLIFLVTALVVLSCEWLSVDIVALALVAGLILTQILTPAEAFGSFGNPILAMIGSLFVLGGALQETGVLREAGRRLARLGHLSGRMTMPIILGIVGVLSAFMNNTTVTALLLQPMTSIARELKMAPSRILMPLAFISICGGTCTLIGTSTNIAVSGYMVQAGLEPVSMFEITGVGVVLLVVAIAYLCLFGPRLLPENREENLEDYAMREYLSEVVVSPKSRLIGETIFQSALSEQNFRILRILRGKDVLVPDAFTRIEASDILLVEGDVKSLMDVKNSSGLEIRADAKLGSKDILAGGELRMVEGVVTPHSPLVGGTLKSLRFRQSYDAIVLALNRFGKPRHQKIGEIPLRQGDTLLIQCARARIPDIMRSSGLAILGETDALSVSKPKALLAVGIFIAAVLATTLGWVPMEVGFLCGALLSVIAGCISIERAREYIDWRLLILIGGMTALGVAMEKSGAAEMLATGFSSVLMPFGITAVLAGFMLLAIFLTQPLSNAAAALVVLPIALQTAELLNANQRTFAIGVMIASSVSLIAPFEPACVLVYGAGEIQV